MSVEIKVPPLGESVVEATIARWLRKEGDPIASGDALVELETDKVNIEVPAERSGVLAQIGRQEGETVNVGDVLGLLSEQAAAAPSAAAPASQTPAPPRPEAAPDGQAASQKEQNPSGFPKNGEQALEDPRRREVPASPAAKALAADNELDLRLVKGSGPGGRIMKENVADAIERRNEAPATANALRQQAVDQTAVEPAPQPAPAVGRAPAPAPQPAAPSGRPEERVRMTRRRQTIAARLVEAQRTAAMLTTFNEIDMSAVMEVRRRRKDTFKERHGVNLGFMSFFTKAVIGALKAFPYLNAEIQGDEIVVKRYYDIGVAVSTEEGLVVPVLRDADRKGFAAIEKGIAELAARARENKLELAELQGGTFTITNGGVFGSLLSTPILNTPQVGILGMHKIEERPIAKDGQVVIRPMMYTALSYDHRIVDGSEAVRFLVRVKELIEDPETLLLEG
jgi:2-oxoglutarate dehydrogenase E2 component (dihydrolipoamide succinyltransferase)